MTIHRPFGKTGISFFPLGLGTIWFGRQWPPGNRAYNYPATQEIFRHLKLAYQTMGNHDGVVMIDTAAAYGDCEARIGNFLRENTRYEQKTFIATKWGEDFDPATGISRVDHTLANLRLSFRRSLEHLGKIDLLYIHKTNASVLRDSAVIGERARMKENKDVRFVGASISDEKVLSEAVKSDLLKPFDVIQMPAPLFLGQFDLADALYKNGTAIVLNSPIRKSGMKNPKASYVELLKNPQASVVLTGTRTHLAETVGYITEE